MHILKLSGSLYVPTATFSFKHKPVTLAATVQLCISYHYSVALTDKHNITDPIYWFFVQRYYMFRLFTSPTIRYLPTNSAVKLL